MTWMTRMMLDAFGKKFDSNETGDSESGCLLSVTVAR